eukprot:TRINITY_DN10648_c0_g1_i2.p6 TRINITY_DN10648_c0_g1~~TRINITY_DN10648_c0_g1_i2.p6  ORF type:complete len:111 (+),score=16.89 TRINITY_DN10648_c0_g1_i2:2387-2719(+)
MKLACLCDLNVACQPPDLFICIWLIIDVCSMQYTCDFEVWMSTLKQSVASATGQALSRGSKDMMSKKLSESAVNADEAMLTPKPMEATVAPANTTEQLELSAEAESVSPE